MHVQCCEPAMQSLSVVHGSDKRYGMSKATSAMECAKRQALSGICMRIFFNVNLSCPQSLRATQHLDAVSTKYWHLYEFWMCMDVYASVW